MNCPTCDTPGYEADTENGIGYCKRRGCVENERPCPAGCDGTGIILEHHHTCRGGDDCKRACPVRRRCTPCGGSGFVLAADLPSAVSW